MAVFPACFCCERFPVESLIPGHKLLMKTKNAMELTVFTLKLPQRKA